VLGVGVSAITMRQAVETIMRWIDTGERHYVCVTGVHGVMESQRDETLRRIHNEAGLVTPDGMPLVWLARHSGYRDVERVYGPDLVLACCGASLSRGDRHFFYGGADGVAERMIERLRQRFRGLRVCGSHTPPFRPLTTAEDDYVVARINAAAPDIVWVGLSTPKQERWMHEHRGRLWAPALVGVGAAFDFHAGIKRQAPYWMQRSGLEWAFRLGCEPRRLGPRYLVNNPLFLWKITQQLLTRPYAA
jgi:N-acetylglucosaminyldiphosphoundecaprenol N-acetyl-beta-D-mannosaminyltransferase